MLADRCYDVWLPNTRGDYYSKENLKNWNFSWDNIAFEDFPLIFNYILKITKQEKFFYVGHSQGTSSIMALLSECPQWNEYIHAASLMSPVAFVSNAELYDLFAAVLAPGVNSVTNIKTINKHSIRSNDKIINIRV